MRVCSRTSPGAPTLSRRRFYPALSLCDLIFSGVFERRPRLTLAIVELAWAPHLLSAMDYTYRERPARRFTGSRPALAKAGDGMLPSDFFRRNVVLSVQEDAIGIRLRHVIGTGNMMWGSDYPHSELTFPRSRKILAGVPDDEQAKPALDHDPGIAAGNTDRVYILTWRG